MIILSAKICRILPPIARPRCLENQVLGTPTLRISKQPKPIPTQKFWARRPGRMMWQERSSSIRKNGERAGQEEMLEVSRIEEAAAKGVHE